MLTQLQLLKLVLAAYLGSESLTLGVKWYFHWHTLLNMKRQVFSYYLVNGMPIFLSSVDTVRDPHWWVKWTGGLFLWTCTILLSWARFWDWIRPKCHMFTWYESPSLPSSCFTRCWPPLLSCPCSSFDYYLVLINV